jgi:hypothetical protein
LGCDFRSVDNHERAATLNFAREIHHLAAQSLKQLLHDRRLLWVVQADFFWRSQQQAAVVWRDANACQRSDDFLPNIVKPYVIAKDFQQVDDADAAVHTGSARQRLSALVSPSGSQRPSAVSPHPVG